MNTPTQPLADKNLITTPAALSPCTSKNNPSISFTELGLESHFYGLDLIGAEIINSFTPDHPRAFWALAKQHIVNHKHYVDTNLIFKPFASDERLLRLGLALLRSGSEKNRIMTKYLALKMLTMALVFSDKSDVWRTVRISENARTIAYFGPEFCFSLMSAAARAGHLAATEQLAAMMPDARLGEKEANPYRKSSSFAWCNMGDRVGQAWAEAALIAETCGKKPSKTLPKAIQPMNGFFWTAIRHHILKESDSASSKRWAQAGAVMIERGLAIENDPKTLNLVMGCAPMRQALMSRRPILGSPSIYSLDRETTILSALFRAPAIDVSEICTYEETSTSCQVRPQQDTHLDAVVVSPIPAAALALLAGHKPDLAWMHLGADRRFKIAKFIIDAAKSSTLLSAEACDRKSFTTGKVYTIQTLAATLLKVPKFTTKSANSTHLSETTLAPLGLSPTSRFHVL